MQRYCKHCQLPYLPTLKFKFEYKTKIGLDPFTRKCCLNENIIEILVQIIETFYFQKISELTIFFNEMFIIIDIKFFLLTLDRLHRIKYITTDGTDFGRHQAAFNPTKVVCCPV